MMSLYCFDIIMNMRSYSKPEKCHKYINIFTLSFFISIFTISICYAEKTLINTKGITIEGGLDIGGAAFFLPNDNFGGNSYVLHPSGRYSANKNVTYAELYGRPMLSGLWDPGLGFKVFGLASAIGSTTVGDGDGESLSQTSGTPRAITLEDANIGVEIPISIGGGHQKLIIQGGRQRFQIDDGFLVGKGTYSAGSRGAWWYAPRIAFSGPGVIKFEGSNIRADVFMLENNTNNVQNMNYDRPQTKFEGFDISWFRNKPHGNGGSVFEDRSAYVTLIYFHVRKADTSSHYDYATRADRDGMNVAALSWGGTLFPVKKFGIDKNFTFYGHFTAEENSHAGNGYQSVEAYGMFFEPGYTFSMLPWSPHLFYRYTRLSGNKNPTGTVKRGYDTFFLYDGRRYTYGGYWPGEIVGLYLAPLSDLEIHQFDLTATPPFHLIHNADQMKLGVHFYDLSLIYPSGMGLKANTGRHISNEVDFTAEYSLDPTTSVAVASGVAFSGPAGRALSRAGVPNGEIMPKIGRYAGTLEMYFYKHF